MSPSDGKPERTGVVFAQVTSAFTAIAAVVYLTGGLALQLRLGLEGLPSSVAVPQLPREFVIGIGLLVVLPSIAVGWLAGWIEVRHPWRKLIGIATGGGLAVGALCYVVIGGTAGLALLAVLSLGGLALTIALGRCRRAPSGDRERTWTEPDVIAIAIATGLLCYVVVGGAVIAKDPFSTKVCLKGGGEALGVLIGETSDRTYIGEPRGSKPRHIISIPESEVSRVIVGGHANDIRNAACH